MKQKAYLIGTHWAAFRRDEAAEIVGVVFLTPGNLPPRACYQLRYADGREDYTPVENEPRNSQVLVPESDVVKRLVLGESRVAFFLKG
jgi:hypothetical protein